MSLNLCSEDLVVETKACETEAEISYEIQHGISLDTSESKDAEILEEESLESWSFKRAISNSTFYDVLLLIWVICIASIVPIIVSLSKDPDTKKAEYSSYFLHGVQEFLKCFFSFVAFLTLCAMERKNVFGQLKTLSFKHWCYFFFASACYAGMNNIDIKVIDHMDPATFQLISRFRLLTTTAIWWLIFRIRINKYQLIALFLIMTGTCIIILPKLWEPKNSNENSVNFDWHGIYLLAIELIFQAAGSISSEWALKKDMEMSIWLQGISMYSWGSLINFILYFTIDRKRVFIIKENPFDKFNKWTYVLCLAYCLFGLTIGVILKRFSTVVKMLQIKGWFIPGACVIIFAVGLYGFGAQKEKDRMKKLKKIETEKNEHEEVKTSDLIQIEPVTTTENMQEEITIHRHINSEGSISPKSSDPDVSNPIS